MIITRFSGAGGMGIFQLASPFYSLISSISLSGITMAVTRLTVEKTASGETAESARVVDIAIRIFLSLLSLCGAITFIAPDFISETIMGDGAVKNSILLFVPCLFFTGFENIYKAFFFGSRHLKPNIISEISEIIIRIAVIFLLLSSNKDALTPELTSVLIVLGMVISEVFSFTFLGIYYRRYNKKIGAKSSSAAVIAQSSEKISAEKKESLTKRLIKQIARIAIPVSASSLLMTIISAVNTIILPQRLTASGMSHQEAIETLGELFGMTAPLVMLPAIFIGPLMNVIIPKVTKLASLDKKDELKRLIEKTLRTGAYLSYPAIGTIAALGGALCVLMYNNADAARFALPYAISCICVYFQIISGALLNALDKQKNHAAYNVADGVIHISLTYFLTAIPGVGVYGYIIGNFASSFTGMTLNMITLKKASGVKISIRKLFITPIAYGIYTAFMAHFTYTFCMRIGLLPLPAAVISIGFAALIYLSILEVRGVSPSKYIRELHVPISHTQQQSDSKDKAKARSLL